MAKSIDNSQDVIDSRDVIARIEELEADREALVEAVTEAQETLADITDDTAIYEPENIAEWREKLKDAKAELAAWDMDSDAEELKTLNALKEEVELATCEWYDGAILVRDSYFEDFAQEEAEILGNMANVRHWPYTCIDWGQAADELKMDYSSVSFDGEDYWVRST